MKPDSYYKLTRPEIARLISGKPARILEIGCAQGNFRHNLPWATEYHGVEPHLPSTIAAREKGIRVYEGTYEDVHASIPDHYFDAVIANDVIEHMSDPWSFLESIKTKMRPNAVLIGSVPNVRYITNLTHLLIRKDWKYEQCGVLDSTHLRFFTIKSLRRLFQQCGYDIQLITPCGPDKFRRIKLLLSPFIAPIGTDVLYMQIAFRIIPQATPKHAV